MRPDNFSNDVRGKYATAFRKGANIIVLDPEVADAFRDSKSVNKALRSLLDIARCVARKR
jgi:hypothetical protein